MAYQTVNPYDNQIVATFDDFTDEQVMDVLAQAQNTFESWRTTSYAQRAAVLTRAAAILRERPDQFAHLLTLEMGKLYSESLGEVELVAQIFDYYAQNAEKFVAPVLLFHGDMDRNVAVHQSELMASKLRGAGKSVELVVYPKHDHQLDNSDTRADMLRKADAFLRANLKIQ